MNIVGIENIVPYKDVYEFKVFEYNDKIDLCNKELFVCDMKVVINRVDSKYENKVEKPMEILALVKNLNSNVDKLTIEDNLKELVLDEVWEENLLKENIELMFIEG